MLPAPPIAAARLSKLALIFSTLLLLAAIGERYTSSFPAWVSTVWGFIQLLLLSALIGIGSAGGVSAIVHFFRNERQDAGVALMVLLISLTAIIGSLAIGLL